MTTVTREGVKTRVPRVFDIKRFQRMFKLMGEEKFLATGVLNSAQTAVIKGSIISIE